MVSSILRTIERFLNLKSFTYKIKRGENIMKKLLIFGILILGLFLIGCTEDMSDADEAELESDLAELSAEELDTVIEAVEADDSAALAGQAIYRKYAPKSNLAKARLLKLSYKVQASHMINFNQRTNFCTVDLENPLTEMCEHPGSGAPVGFLGCDYIRDSGSCLDVCGTSWEAGSWYPCVR
jgi:hypothetical protein